MFSNLPQSALDAMDWSWEDYRVFYDNLEERALNTETLEKWMQDWSALEKLIYEVLSRMEVNTALDTADEKAEKQYFSFLEEIYPHAETASQKAKEKYLESGLPLENFSIQLRNMKAEASLYREENLPLLSEEKKLGNAYDKVIGAQSIQWEGEEITLQKLAPVYQDEDRAKREKAWKLEMGRWQVDRGEINTIWKDFMDLRGKIAKNAGMDNYRTYRFSEMLRLDYGPQDCLDFDAAIEEVVVPAASKIYEKRKERLGLDQLRPWDLNIDTTGLPPLRPYQEEWEFKAKATAIFNKVDPELGKYFEIMQEENLLDLTNRKGKAPGAFCVDYLTAKRPFIFMNAVGLHDDVQTLLHEVGHGFHVFESIHLPYRQQLAYGAEIAEVASMGMELLASPYLAKEQGGFYTEAEAARARIEHLEGSLLFWPYMAVVDAFQHWVYENHEAATDPAKCDAEWASLWDRYMKGIDYAGFEEMKMTGWHRKLHIFQVPFYYVDYGLAQLGAVQIWANAIGDQAGAVKSYRNALSLGATRSLPELFAVAGAKFAFDADTLGKATKLMADTIEELEAVS
ncbi:MAG: M3 family oligoendopeptidase [Chloroflexi bacterium]|jgi:oligoendopeptidase F|nr:M3 family oligoendopeptidase [Chloroflexota bacterium]MBT3670183.1 M3 family oligoendopeptidase [Chloroflexota bacterium]MBT4004053.1 M3 family oligoendopeptidase [Chloroflexota bacterium]MBT4306143.1 M3 family oligoendopeptidase [Chloroflexota bacterium]MBT4534523.1 M3 family oligoendopeptidase [Chloroflexota bacterium]